MIASRTSELSFVNSLNCLLVKAIPGEISRLDSLYFTPSEYAGVEP